MGFLGPVPVAEHLAHARAFAAAAPGPPTTFLDLGSGGGVPGLALALAWPEARACLLDGSTRRAAFLRRAVRALQLADRVEVVGERAEVAGHSPAWRGSMDLVVVRSFGPPATVAECAAPFLRVGGVLLVSEPPGAPDRWPAAGLEQLGLVPGSVVQGIRRLDQVALCRSRLPRRTPGRPPLF